MWVVMIRVNERAKWCAHGPFADHEAAKSYEHKLAGSNMQRQIVKLIKPWEGKK